MLYQPIWKDLGFFRRALIFAFCIVIPVLSILQKTPLQFHTGWKRLKKSHFALSKIWVCFIWIFAPKIIWWVLATFWWDNCGLFSTTVITSWCFKLISPFKSSNNVSFSFMMHFLRGSKSKTWCSCMLSGRIEYEFSRLINILPTHFRTAAVQNMTTSTSCFFCKVVSTNVIYEGIFVIRFQWKSTLKDGLVYI